MVQSTRLRLPVFRGASSATSIAPRERCALGAETEWRSLCASLSFVQRRVERVHTVQYACGASSRRDTSRDVLARVRGYVPCGAVLVGWAPVKGC